MVSTERQIGGRVAEQRDIAETLALGRQHKKRIADSDREAKARDANARAVGAALKKSESAKRTCTLTCRPAFVRGTRKGSINLNKFEKRIGLTVPRKSYVSSTGFSSFHCKLTARGGGTYRAAKDRQYRRGEAVVAVRYILRDAAREIEGGGMISSIGRDADTIASFFCALEELEGSGRSNANIYNNIVVSLPHEKLDREALLAEICRPLKELELAFVAVLHAPDPCGDAQNFHAHHVHLAPI